METEHTKTELEKMWDTHCRACQRMECNNSYPEIKKCQGKCRIKQE